VIDCRTRPKDLSAQKLISPSRVVVSISYESNLGTGTIQVNSRGSASKALEMDLGILVGIAMLVIWGIGALAFDGPGWIHLLLTVGVFVIIWRIVVRGARRHPEPR
jgi:hypothetical protein